MYKRQEHGCPWDRKQTHESLKPCLKEESEEVFAAIDNHDMENLCEELGDEMCIRDRRMYAPQRTYHQGSRKERSHSDNEDCERVVGVS